MPSFEFKHNMPVFLLLEFKANKSYAFQIILNYGILHCMFPGRTELKHC